MADSIKLIATGIAKGLQDAVLGTRRIYHLDLEIKKREQFSPRKQPQSTLARRRAERMQNEDIPESNEKKTPSVLNRLLLCCAWNGGVFMASILAFNHLILPLLRYLTETIFYSTTGGTSVWSWLGPTLSWTFSSLWTLPLFILSKIVNGLWFQDIADAAYRTTRGRPQMLPSLSKIIADLLFSLVLQSLFLIQGMLASFLPIRGIGDMVGVLHMCLLYSLYAFEYKWFNMGWEVHKRLSYIEINWPYFVGFGLPLAVLTALPSSYIMSGCVFSLLFPLFIISANEADKIQQQYATFPLQLFAPTVAISNSIFQSSVNRGSAQSQPQPQRQDQNY